MIMSAIAIMGWNKVQRRWFKRYRGKLYFVSPKQLHCEPTKDASRVAANSWWEAKQSEIDEALGELKKLPAHIVEHYQEAKENWRLFGKWHRRYGNQDEAQKSDTMLEWLDEALASDNPLFPLNKSQFDPREKFLRKMDVDDKISADLVWMDRFNAILKEEQNEKLVPLHNTIRCHIDNYLALRKAQFQARNKIGSYFSQAQWMNLFRNWVEPTAPIEDINEALWQKFFMYLAGKVANGEYTPITAKCYLQVARSFIRSEYESNLIALPPRNLNSKQLAFSGAIKDPVVFTVEEVRHYLGKAKDKLKLFILLMLNCGMYGSDIGTLAQNEVNWETGRICRKRTKTRNRSENVPKVDYPLWSETFRLLKCFRSEHPTLVLLNNKNEPLVEESDKDGKWHRKNNIKGLFFQFQFRELGLKKPEQRKPLKSFRKTGATLLEQSVYGRFSEHYLGEAPSTMASRHYVHKNGPEFDEAILWLGKQLGIE
jgi:integrase